MTNVPSTETHDVVSFDFATQQQGGAQIPAGRWDVAVFNLTPEQTAKGLAYTGVELEIIGGHYTPEGSPFLGRRIKPKQPWLLGLVLVATGYAPKDSKATVTVERSALIDYPLVVDLSYRAFDGKEFANITTVLAADDAVPPVELPF